jgi:hypothetical protein
MFGQNQGLAAGSAQSPSASVVFDKTSQLRSLLLDIADRIRPVIQESPSSSDSMKSPSSNVPLHRELDELIGMATELRNSIVL